MTYEEAVQYLRHSYSCKSFVNPVRWESLGPYFDYTAGESEITLDGSEPVLFVVLGAFVAVGFVQPATIPQAIAAGIGWTGLLSK